MKLVNRNDLESWAERFDSKSNLPILISRLVRATTPLSTQSDFPSGSSVFIGGWDGIVQCKEDRAYVPKGISLWEFGTETNNKGKADDDYDKRTADSLGFDKSECVFIFITPRFWRQKDKWCREKQSEGIWKEIRVYDSSIIEQWLDTATAVSRWFSSFVDRYPLDGIQTTEEFWEEWSIGPKGILEPEVVTSGRDKETRTLLEFLQANPGIRAVKASTKKEAVAFIIASAKQFETSETERFFSKSLIVDTEANYRSIRINSATPLNLIPRFDETQPLYAAVSNGHHVLVPLGADDSFNQETINLPTIDREGQVTGLEKMGLNRDDAEKFSRESGRNITILKKLLGFPQNKAEWITTENIREIIPALLIGRWNERFVGDREIIEKISGVKYEEYAQILLKWRDLEESPLIQIGETWRLTSPLDAWTSLSSNILKSDFEMLKECFMYAFQNGNPFIEDNLRESRVSIFDNREKLFSSWSREGLTQSLILIGLFGDGLKIPQMPFAQSWVDDIIHKLIFKAEGSLWISLNHELPLISEASPNSFIEAVKESLSNDIPSIMDMFIEIDGFLSPSSNHTGLLWALEGLAWIPDYLFNASSILLKLSSLDPGGKLANRPLNSLCEIFKPWHFQTLVSYDERMEVIKQITFKEKKIAWEFLRKMLPEDHDIAEETHKMRWRMYNLNTDLSYTYQEIWDTHSFVVELMISLFDYSEQSFSQIIDNSVKLSPHDRDKVLKFAESEYSKIIQNDFSSWHTIRKILSHHRSYPNTEWALKEDELIRYESLYEKLQPDDLIQKYIWLFEDDFLAFPEGNIYEDDINQKGYELRLLKNDETRIVGLKKIIEKYNIEKIKELSKTVKKPWILGNTLASIILDESQILSITELLNNDEKNLNFVYGFIFQETRLKNLDWLFSLYEKLKIKNYTNKALSRLFVPVFQSKELWAFIDSTNEEIKCEYWLSVQPRFHGLINDDILIGINHLIDYKRYFSAVDVCSIFSENLPTELIVEVLIKLATVKSNEPVNISGYEIELLFKMLDKRLDISHETLIHLEWLYLSILDSHGTNRNPKNLHNELSTNPEFFIDVLKCVYTPKNKENIEEERKGLSDEAVMGRARQAYQLLRSWKKIPGVNSENSIDNDYLKHWIETVRILAEKADRLSVADSHIGQILAQYPESIPNWPPEEICNTIENVNSESLRRNFKSALFNKRGSSSRGAFDGGDIEREHAKYFEELAIKHKYKHPNVAAIFSKLSMGYFLDAKRIDESAERDRLEY